MKSKRDARSIWRESIEWGTRVAVDFFRVSLGNHVDAMMGLGLTVNFAIPFSDAAWDVLGFDHKQDYEHISNYGCSSCGNRSCYRTLLRRYKKT